ncbi:hypothetical protein J14TS2_04620 [Bacillus sp. J14TS2]|uniref:hypothetical protein n=1 Tax=Bacillus sp. J14TS2 TaxID=2807188 RepID=UPI001B2D60CB|nr:hypothetical protein [Bacillus sp. J14TS2]GIN69987.1 hypothetical protein J14TS2_04620 [Bacillus sp. J14TS2]
MTNLKLLFLFRLKNQMKLANLNSSNKEVQKHAIYTISGYITAFLMFLGYVLFISIDLNESNNIQAFFVLLSSMLFWTLGIWNNLSGFDDIIDGKDSDFIFSLPLKSWQARLLSLFSKYVIHTILTFIVLAFGYILTISFISHYFLVLLLIVLLSIIIPLLATNLPFLISLFVRNLLTLIKFRNNVTESVITLGLFVTPFIYFIFNSESIDYKDWFINASILQYSLDEITEFHFLLNLILLSVFAVVSSLIVIFVLDYFHHFLKNQKGKQLKRKNKNSTWTVNTPIIAFLVKEFKLYFSSLTYVSNTMLTPIGMVALNICVLIGIIPNIQSYSYDLVGYTITAQHIFTMIIFIFLILTTTTSCSLSFEGRSIWIMLVAPIRITTIALAKILLNILLFLPGIALTVIVFYAVFNVSMPYLLTMIVFMFTTLLLISTAGLLVNLRFPSYTWSNDMEVVKQSKATIITAIISMLTIPVIISAVFLDHPFLIVLIIIIEIVAIMLMLLKVSTSNMMLN